MPEISIPEVVPYLLAILGLLIVWQIHNIQVRAGTIKAVDLWSQSGIRLFVQAAPEDPHNCAACRDAYGMAFSPSVVAAKKFRPTDQTCANPGDCRCLMVGLYGAWPEAERLQAQLKAHDGRVRLSREKFGAFIDGAQARRSGVNVDQVSLAILEAMRAEENNSNVAIEHYRFVVDNAQEERDLPFIVPSYLRLTDLLERAGRHKDALEMVEQFYKVFDETSKKRHGPTQGQLAIMSLRKTRLVMATTT
ncbi:MAG: hypothetical protein HY581_06365 [Nitrospirae bacterium]|nr:hypothetical protein [Nitrospirota bacterium]